MSTNPTTPAVKGFDRDLKCLGFAYEIGKTYTHAGSVSVCASGFHGCEMPLDVWTYYGPADSRFGAVDMSGYVDRDDRGDSKIAAATIRITAELHLPDVIKRAVAWVSDRAKGNTATGYNGHAAATGDRGHAAATGDRGHAAATGDSGHAAVTGYGGHAAAKGQHGIAVSIGPNATAEAGPDGWLVLAAWRWSGERSELVTVRTAKVGGPEGIEAGVRYCLSEACDFERVEA